MYVSEPWSCKDLCCRLWEGQRALGIHKQYLNLCSEDERRSHGFGMTWRWVVNDRIIFFSWTIPLSFSVFVVLMFVSLSLSWSSPELEPSQIRLIVYQDCERRGRNVLFDSDARKRSTEDAPVTVSAVRTRGLISSNNSISWLWVCKHSFTFTWLKACPALCHVCWLLVVLCHEAVGAVQKPVLQKNNIFHTCSCHLTATWREFWSVFPQSAWTECDEIKNMNLKVIQLMKSVDVAKLTTFQSVLCTKQDFCGS